MNKKIVHDALVLFAFTVVLGLILGVVYGITKPSIDQVNYEKTQAAYNRYLKMQHPSKNTVILMRTQQQHS